MSIVPISIKLHHIYTADTYHCDPNVPWILL